MKFKVLIFSLVLFFTGFHNAGNVYAAGDIFTAETFTQTYVVNCKDGLVQLSVRYNFSYQGSSFTQAHTYYRTIMKNRPDYYKRIQSLCTAPASLSYPGMKTIRKEKPLSILFSLGWNSFIGDGAIFSFNISPHVFIEPGLGFAFRGPLMYGIRGRWNFLTSHSTPYVAFGLAASIGMTDTTIEANGKQADYKVPPTLYYPLSIGYDFVANDGFEFQIEAGHTLYTGRIQCVSGSCDDKDVRNEANAELKGGFLVSISIGYAFNTY